MIARSASCKIDHGKILNIQYSHDLSRLSECLFQRICYGSGLLIDLSQHVMLQWSTRSLSTQVRYATYSMVRRYIKVKRRALESSTRFKNSTIRLFTGFRLAGSPNHDVRRGSHAYSALQQARTILSPVQFRVQQSDSADNAS